VTSSPNTPKKYLNNFSNRFRKSPSPNRQYQLNNRGGPNQTSRIPKSHFSPIHRTNFIPGHGVRRSSGSSGLPPLPPNISTRSHSLDGLLETTATNNQLGEATGEDNQINTSGCSSFDENKIKSNDVNMSKESIKSSMDSVKKRRSRSLDDLLDNDSLIVEDMEDDDEHTQSMENILENTHSETNNINMNNNNNNDNNNMDHSLILCSSPTPSEKPCENEVLEIMDNSIEIQNSKSNSKLNEHLQNDDSGIQCNSSDNDSLVHRTDNEDNVSMSISVASSADQRDEKKNKKFLNKYVSKVKKLMKK
jgi:hypothetical protein